VAAAAAAVERVVEGWEEALEERSVDCHNNYKCLGTRGPR
jgi:hypothetical protein